MNGASLSAQQQKINEYASLAGVNLARMVLDRGQSAKTLKRHGMQQIMQAVRAGEIGTLVVLKLDRLTRIVGDLANLVQLFDKYQVSLISVVEHLDTGSAAGRLMLHLLSSVSQWEREAIADRTSFVLAHKRRSGNVYGHVPYGFSRYGSKLVPNEAEQSALRGAVEMRRCGASWRAIGLWLHEKGFAPRQGGKAWYPATVRALLTSKMTEDLLAGVVK